MQNSIKLVECPRDAMQGIKEFIPTDKKIKYLNLLLKAGFDTLDFGSFVSPKAIPQMQDTAEVLSSLDPSETKLLAIIANLRGAQDACKHERIRYLGFPFSISETFQKRNTNSGIEESLNTVKDISELCSKHNKKLVVYISMAFGNPYGDVWNDEVAIRWSERLYSETGVKILALSDTVGVSNPEIITTLFSGLIPALPQVEFGAHLHTTPDTWKEKIQSAWDAGCRRFDGALKGYGGCPMAKDDLTGNMPTENIISFCEENQIPHTVKKAAFAEAMVFSTSIFS